MRQALRQNQVRGRRSTPVTLPAPIMGLNKRDALADMDPGYAFELVNWFPETNYLRVRRGFTEHGTGVGSGDVPTLMTYASGTAQKLLACSATNIYDATRAGTATSLVGSKTNGNWQHVNITNSGTAYLLAVNGADTPIKYQGSAVSDIGSGAESAITGTGLTATDLVNICLFKKRVYFCENDTLSFWYLSASAIGGAAVEFPLDDVASKGGYLMAQSNWTIDGGNGVDDLLVSVTSEGQAIVYSGSNPGSDFTLVGSYDIAPPIGRRCMFHFGGDLLVITTAGIVSMTDLFQRGRVEQSALYSYPIQQAWTDETRVNADKAGWQAVVYPKGQMAVVNVPIIASTQYDQFAVNTATGAWTRFDGMNGLSWAVVNGTLYFGGVDGRVMKADTTNADEGADIQADCKQAYSFFDTPGFSKHFRVAQPLLAAGGDFDMYLTMLTDFEDRALATPDFSVAQGAGGEWDTGTWDVSLWGDDLVPVNPRLNVGGMGYAGALGMRVTTANTDVTWAATTVFFERGGLV